LVRVLDLVDTVVRRTAYLALLFENPMALSQLVRLCHSSPWISNLLTRYPVLLDELLDARTLYVPLTKSQLEAELRERLAELPADDLEAHMEALRHFKQTNVLRVAAADVTGAVPLMRVSDQLTWIAEVVVEEVLELAWNHLVAKHGRPLCSADGEVCDKGFAVIAYGKLGGIELGYGSDLDLVFVHAAESDELDTDGEQPIAVPTFFARLGQRIIHILTSQTPSGVLYEVDMRLRPSGASGLLVSSLGAFERYQREQAWTWEHQALVRARAVAGDAGVGERFVAIRRDVLSREREPSLLRREVREMRERMREANTKAHTPEEFDLKQDPGGIADIEFMVQYGVLAWARAHPQLLTYTDNIRILDGFAEEGLLPSAECALLADAYRAYRAAGHRQTLLEQAAVVSAADFGEYRARVTALWDELMAD
jgi:glutamate-ammonia-ligase adenylyltransferase